MPTEPRPLEKAPLAYENPDFLNGPDGRVLRILAEYSEPMSRFQRERIEDTVVFFGSARFHAPADTASQASDAEAAGYYEDARTLAHLLTAWAKDLPGPRHRFVVTSGGGPGIMEAANRGAHEAGGKTIGLNILLPFEQRPNPWITPALNFEFHYFFMRKFWFAYLAKALVVFPGGFGTLDEMFELLTLAQTDKLDAKMTIIIYGSAYWRGVINLDLLAEKGAIAAKDKDLFRFADTPEDAFALLKAGLESHCTFAAEPVPRPTEPAPSAQHVLGPDIAKTR